MKIGWINHKTIIGIISYTILLILSIYFYKERTIFLDSSFYLFYLLKDGDFTIINDRFGAFITQILPLLASKFAISLSNVMKLYSASFVLCNFSIFLFISLVLKSSKFAIVLLLFNVCIVTDTFYWMLSEYPQGIAIAILYFATICTMKRNENYANYWVLPFNLILLLVIAFIYPLIIVPFFFVLIYLYLIARIEKKWVVNISISFLAIYILKIIFFKSGYDSTSMGGLKNFITFFPNYFSMPSNGKFIRYLIKDYYFLPIGLVLVVLYYFRSRSSKTMIFVFISFFSYLLLVNVSFPNGADQFYIENLYLPLSLFLIFPLVFEILPSIHTKISLVILTIIILTSLVRIGFNHTDYTTRLEWMRGFLQKTTKLENQKLMIPTDAVPIDTLFMTWASAYEFWLLSTVELGTTKSILIDETLDEHSWILAYNKKFATKWGAFDYNDLPIPYFILNDTTYYQANN